MFIPLSKLIPLALNRKGITKEAQAAHVCEAFRKIAPELIHPEALDNIHPKYFQRGILTVAVTHSAWAALIVQKKAIIIRELRTHLRGVPLNGIRTTISVQKEEFTG